MHNFLIFLTYWNSILSFLTYVLDTPGIIASIKYSLLGDMPKENLMSCYKKMENWLFKMKNPPIAQQKREIGSLFDTIYKNQLKNGLKQLNVRPETVKLLDWPGIKPAHPEVKVWSLNHWASREIQSYF